MLCEICLFTPLDVGKWVDKKAGKKLFHYMLLHLEEWFILLDCSDIKPPDLLAKMLKPLTLHLLFQWVSQKCQHICQSYHHYWTFCPKATAAWIRNLQTLASTEESGAMKASWYDSEEALAWSAWHFTAVQYGGCSQYSHTTR